MNNRRKGASSMNSILKIQRCSVRAIMIAVAVGCTFHGMQAGQPEGRSGPFTVEAKNDASEGSDQALYEKGMEHLKARQFEKARQAFQSMIQSYPDSMLAADAYLAIGDSYYEQGGAENLLQAKEQYQNFIVFFPTNPKNAEILMKVLAIGKKGIGAQDEKVLLWAEEHLDAFLQNPPDSNQAQGFSTFKE
jgi:TolA-binding protein